MKLNPDCVRAILLTVEDSCEIGKTVRLPDERGNHLQPYFENEILYHVRQCELCGLLHGVHALGGGKLSYLIEDLSPYGHSFLANVRQDNIWNKTKTIAERIGSKSLDALIQVSSNVITELIRAQFGL